jgi:hypothetical protein
MDPVTGDGASVPVAAAGADAITVKGTSCGAACERSHGGSCGCPAATERAKLRLFHGKAVAAAAADACYRHAFDFNFCSATPYADKAADTLGFFVETGGASTGAARRAAPVCRQPNKATAACGCVAGQTRRRLALPVPAPSGGGTRWMDDVSAANVTFCAPPKVNVIVVNPATGACVQPLGENHTCGCSAGMNVIALSVAYRNETTGAYEKGTLVLCAAEPVTAKPALTPTETTVTSTVTVFGAVAGGPAAPLIQGASMMMLMGCIPDDEVPDKSAVTPFSIGATRLRHFFGMLALAGGAFGVHLLLLSILVAVITVQGRRDDAAAPLGELALRAMNRARFPSLTVKALFFAFQGLCYESVALFVLPRLTALETAVGVLGTALCAGFLVFVQYWGTLAGRDQTLFAASYTTYGAAFAGMGRALRALLPPGYWRGSHGFIARFGALYDTFSHVRISWVAGVHLIRAFIIALATLFQPGTDWGCAALHIALAGICVLFAVFFAALRPHRVPVNDLVCVIINLLTALLSLAIGLKWAAIRTDRLYLAIVGIALISVVINVGIMVAERVKWRRVEERRIADEEAAAAAEVGSDAASSDAGECGGKTPVAAAVAGGAAIYITAERDDDDDEDDNAAITPDDEAPSSDAHSNRDCARPPAVAGRRRGTSMSSVALRLDQCAGGSGGGGGGEEDMSTAALSAVPVVSALLTPKRARGGSATRRVPALATFRPGELDAEAAGAPLAVDVAGASLADPSDDPQSGLFTPRHDATPPLLTPTAISPSAVSVGLASAVTSGGEPRSDEPVAPAVLRLPPALAAAGAVEPSSASASPPNSALGNTGVFSFGSTGPLGATAPSLGGTLGRTLGGTGGSTGGNRLPPLSRRESAWFDDDPTL